MLLVKWVHNIQFCLGIIYKVSLKSKYEKLFTFYANTFAILHANKVIVISPTASVGEGLTGFVSWIKMVTSHIGGTQALIFWTVAI